MLSSTKSDIDKKTKAAMMKGKRILILVSKIIQNIANGVIKFKETNMKVSLLVLFCYVLFCFIMFCYVYFFVCFSPK